MEQTTALFLGNYHLEKALQDLYCILARTNLRIRQESYAHLLFKGSKYLSNEVMNFYINNLSTFCGHTTALRAKFPTSYTIDAWALFQIIPLDAKEHLLINFTNLVSDCEAMEALYGESYDELLLSEIHTWYQSFPKTISKVLEHYKTHNIETEFLFFPINVNKSHWALLIADIKNKKSHQWILCKAFVKNSVMPI